MDASKIDLKDYIRDIPDFPKQGILFRDITPLLCDNRALSSAIDALAEPFTDSGIEYVAAVEARGFIFGSAVAKRLDAGFVPIRKEGKLPYKSLSITYDLEYGTDTLEIHSDDMRKGAKVLMVDDLLATGGTMEAACRLVKKAGGEIAGLTFLIELSILEGRVRLADYPIHVEVVY